MLCDARRYFEERDVLEVDTPVLSGRAITEPNIESLRIEGDEAKSLYLQTSPEHFMKRMLADGYPDVYQICKVFRDGETGRNHRTEFTMVEWYRHNFSLQNIMQDTIDFVCRTLNRDDLASSAESLNYADAFRKELQVNVLDDDVQKLSALANADEALVKSMGDDRDAWLDLLLTSKIARNFPHDRLTLLYHYPASQAALARCCPEDSRLADRFELYYGSLELANGFVELADADEQLDRFENDRNRRRQLGLTVHAADEALIAALRQGLPPCAGVAVGFDRLLMVRTGCDDIADVNTFDIESR